METTAYPRRWPGLIALAMVAGGAALEVGGALAGVALLIAVGALLHLLTSLLIDGRVAIRRTAIVVLDRTGIEGEFGRLPWSAVSRASIEWRWRRGWRLPLPHRALVLRTSKRVLPSASELWAATFFGGRARLDDEGGEAVIPLWTGEARVKQLVRHYRNRPFAGEIV